MSRKAVVMGTALVLMLVLSLSGSIAGDTMSVNLGAVTPSFDTPKTIQASVTVTDNDPPGTIFECVPDPGDAPYTLSATGVNITAGTASISVPCGGQASGMVPITVEAMAEPGTIAIEFRASGPDSLTQTVQLTVNPYTNFDIKDSVLVSGNVEVHIKNMGSGASDIFTVYVFEGNLTWEPNTGIPDMGMTTGEIMQGKTGTIKVETNASGEDIGVYVIGTASGMVKTQVVTTSVGTGGPIFYGLFIAFIALIVVLGVTVVGGVKMPSVKMPKRNKKVEEEIEEDDEPEEAVVEEAPEEEEEETVSDDSEDLNALTKAQLMERLDEAGIEYNKSDTKAALIEKLQ